MTSMTPGLENSETGSADPLFLNLQALLTGALQLQAVPGRAELLQDANSYATCF